MKRFSFNLEGILSLREFEEKNAKNDLAKSIAEANTLQQNLENIAQERVRVNNLRNNTSDLFYLQSCEQYVNKLDVQKEDTLESLAEIQLVIEKKQKILVDAMQKRKAIEKLKEKKIAEWKKENIKAEESAIEDSAYSHYN